VALGAAGVAVAAGLVVWMLWPAPRPAEPTPPPPPEPAREEDTGKLRIASIEPGDAAVVRGRRAWVRWTTSVRAAGRLHWRKAGDPEFKVVEAVEGRFLIAELPDLELGAVYEYKVEASAGGETVSSGVRKLGCEGGLEFDPPQVEARIARDYDQIVRFRIKNSSEAGIRVAARALAEFDELPAEMVGPGSQDEPIDVEPGRSASLTLAVNAADAARADYEIPVDAAGALVKVRLIVAIPAFKLSFRVVSEDPVTLAKTVEVSNEGGPLTDLSIRIAEPNEREAIVMPAAKHAPLASGNTLLVAVSPILYLEFEGIALELECRAAGQAARFPLRFDRPGGRRLMGIRTATQERSHSHDKYCTNRPDSCSQLPGPDATGSEEKPPEAKDKGQEVIDTLRKYYVGKPNYTYQEGTKGKVVVHPKKEGEEVPTVEIRWDCSGLISQLLTDMGFPDPNTGPGKGCENIAGNFKKVDAKEARPGDVIVFDYHGYRNENTGADKKTNPKWTEKREADGVPDHCGFVSETDGTRITKVIHITSSKKIHEEDPSEEWSGYYDQATTPVGSQNKLSKYITGIYRPNYEPKEGVCSAGGGCDSKGKQ
jgi:hypothetical protein